MGTCTFVFYARSRVWRHLTAPLHAKGGVKYVSTKTVFLVRIVMLIGPTRREQLHFTFGHYNTFFSRWHGNMCIDPVAILAQGLSSSECEALNPISAEKSRAVLSSSCCASRFRRLLILESQNESQFPGIHDTCRKLMPKGLQTMIKIGSKQ